MANNPVVPRISVVMGVYNAGESLGPAVESILAQQGVDFEFILVNDGSTDGTGEKLDAFARRDPRVRVIHQENRGLTCALTRGCAEARGEFIARQDADDISRPGRLAAQLERATAADRPVMVSPGCDWKIPEGRTLLEIRPPLDPALARRQILEEGRALCCHGALLFRSDAYAAAGGYRPPFLYAQDIDLILRLAERGPVAALPGCHYEYLYSASTITGRHAPLQVKYLKLAMEAHRRRTLGGSDDDILQQAQDLREQCLADRGRVPAQNPAASHYFVASLLRDLDPALARVYLLRAARCRPCDPRIPLRWLLTFLPRRPRRP